MHNILTLSAAALIAAPTAALAAPPSNATETLRQSVHRVMVSSYATPPGQDKRPYDPDQGDDNAALRAITEVCTKDTPAADRSAICDRTPVSPD